MYPAVQWKDPQGRDWVLEDDGTLETQKKIKAAIPVQSEPPAKPAVIANFYKYLADADTAEKVLAQIVRCVKWCSLPDFKVRTVRATLQEKLELPMTEDQRKAMTLAIKSLDEKGAISKKLKACIKLMSGESEE